MPFKALHIAKYFGEKKVLQDVSFELEKGKAVVLVGANGSGKTTLFNIIMGFLKADKGEVFLHGEKINSLSPDQRNRKGINRTFQNMRLIGKLTVLENILLALKSQSGENWWQSIFPFQKAREEQKNFKIRVKEILEQCFIADVAEGKADEISYGQQKLLNLACCIANDAEVVLLDEPVAGVNPVYREKLEGIIQGLKRKKAFLIIEHNTDFIEKVADELLFLHNGQVTQFSDYDTMRQNEEVQAAYI